VSRSRASRTGARPRCRRALGAREDRVPRVCGGLCCGARYHRRLGCALVAL